MRYKCALNAYNFIRKNAYNKVKTKYNEDLMVSNYINLIEKS